MLTAKFTTICDFFKNNSLFTVEFFAANYLTVIKIMPQIT